MVSVSVLVSLAGKTILLLLYMNSYSIATIMFINFLSHFDTLPSGFEDVIQVHFAIQREAIMKQLSQWVKEVISPEHERRLRKAIDDFRAEMDKL